METASSDHHPGAMGPVPTDPQDARLRALRSLLSESLRTGRPAFCERCRSEIQFTPAGHARFSSRCRCAASDADSL